MSASHEPLQPLVPRPAKTWEAKLSSTATSAGRSGTCRRVGPRGRTTWQIGRVLTSPYLVIVEGCFARLDVVGC